MRHLGSLLLALFFAPVVLVLTGRGIDSFRDAAASQPPDPLAGAAALASLLLAGILVAVLIMPRLSPLGLLLAGLGYLAFGAWAMVDPDLFVVTTGWRLLGWDRSTVAATGAVALLLAMPMVLSIFSVQRWRHPRNRWPAAYPAGPYGGGTYPAGYPAPAYPPAGPAYGAPVYGGPGGYGTPDGYGAHAYGAPAYGAPAYGGAGSGAPGFAPATGPLPGHPIPYANRPDPTLEMPAVSGDDPPTEAIPTSPTPGPPPAGSPASDEPTMVTQPDEPTVVTEPDEPTVATPPEAPSEPTTTADDDAPSNPTDPDTVDQGDVPAVSPEASVNKSEIGVVRP